MDLLTDSQTEDSSSSAQSRAGSTARRAQAEDVLGGRNTVIEGTVRAESDLRARGHVIGTLEVDGKTTVAEEGSVDGEIVATSAEIAGQVQGEIHVEERLVLKSTARVEGTIETGRLVVEEGAQLTGECEVERTVSEGTEASEKTDGEPRG